MEPGIIHSRKSKSSHPVIAFLFSLFFVGLGQIYNGEFLKGIAFFIIRSILLMLIPLSITLKTDHSYLFTAAVLTIAALVISIGSPLESLIHAIKHHKITLKRNNTWYIYILYSLFTTFITLLFCYIITLTFTIKKVTTDSGIPSIQKNEYILIKTYSPKGYTKGELVYFGDNKIGRIASIEKEIKYANNALFINNNPLKYSLCSNTEIDTYPQKYHQYLLMEKNGLTIHPIVIDLKKKIGKDIKYSPDKDSILIISDNRLEEISIQKIGKIEILGRIEGVIFSESINRIFLIPQKAPPLLTQ